MFIVFHDPGSVDVTSFVNCYRLGHTLDLTLCCCHREQITFEQEAHVSISQRALQVM